MNGPPPAARPSSRRTRAFRIVAGILGFATVALTVPFTITSFTNDADAVHRMHNTAALITYGLLLGATLLVCAWRPTEQLVVFRVVGAASLASAIAGVISGDVVAGGSLIGVVGFAIALALHPSRERVLRLGRLHAEPAVLAALAFIPGIAWAMTQSNLQRHGVPSVDPHAELHHYSTMASVGLTLPLVALVACFGGRGRLLAARIVGASWILLGIASLLLHDHVGAFDTLWSWWLVGAGLAFIALSEVSERRIGPSADARPRTLG